MAITNADGSIVLTTKVDQSGLKSGLSTMKSGASSIGGSFKKLGAAVAAAFSVKVLIDFGKQASSTATKAEASVQRLIDIYGSASKAVGDFIDANAQALGMSRAAATSYASVYGNLFSVWADQQTNATLTTRYLQMTAVVASKTGRTVEDVQERIRSGLLGNTEAIEDLGVFVNVKTIEMTDSFKRMANGRSWEQLDAYTQQQVRTMAILEQATAKYGDEVAQTSALAKSRFNAAWQDFQATWGQVINRFLVPALDVLTDILTTSTAVMQTLFSVSNSTIAQGESVGKATSEQEDYNESLKETQKQLAGFDEIQTLSSSEKESSKSGGLVIEPIDTETSKNAQKLSPVFEEILSVFEPLSKIDFSNLKNSLLGLLDPIKMLSSVSWNALKGAIKNVFTPLSEFVIEDVLPEFFEALESAISILSTTLENAWDILNQFIVDFLDPIWDYTEPQINSFLHDMNEELKEFAKIFYESEAWQDLKTILSSIYKILEPVVKWIIDFIMPINKFRMNNAFDELGFSFKTIEDTLGLIAALITGDFDDAFQHLKDLFLDNAIDLFKDKLQALSDLIEDWTGFDLAGWLSDVWEAAKSYWNENIAPVFTKERWLRFLDTTIISGFETGLNVLIEKLNGFDIKLPNALGGGTLFDVDIDPVDFSLSKYYEKLPSVALGTTIPTTSSFTQPSPPSSQNSPSRGLSTEVVLELDGRELGRAVVEQGNMENRRIGTRLALA